MREASRRALLAAALAACSLASAASLEQNVQRLEQIRTDIEAAIRDKDGTPRGGLANAAADIRAIPDKTVFEQSYVAWSNATVSAGAVVTNAVPTGYMLLPYLQANGGQFFRLTDTRANQDTFSELKFTDLDTTGTTMMFGSRYGNLYEMHIYNGHFGFPYNGSWNDNVAPATPDAVLTMDANNFYVDGVLKQTVTKSDFSNTDYLILFSSRFQSGYKYVTGKFHYADIRRALNPSTSKVKPDVLLLPALDPNGTVCVVDVKSDPSNPTKYYNDTSNAWPAQPEPTNEWIHLDIVDNRFTCVLPTPYETNIVDSAANKQVINDATEYIYQRISDL